MRVNKYLLKFKLGETWLIVNPLHETAIKLDEEALTALFEGKYQSFSKDEIDALKSMGILVEETFDELSFLRKKLIKEEEHLEKLVKAAFIVTWACNFDCKYCFEKKIKPLFGSDSMSVEQIKEAFAFINWYAPDCKITGIEITGGEPLLIQNYNLISEILENAAKNNTNVAITTNGYNLDYYSSLLCKYAEIITGVRVTLDGPKEVHDKRRPLYGGHGTFDKIVKGIETLLANGFDKRKIFIIVKVDEENVNALPELIRFLIGKGWFGNMTIGIGVPHSYGNWDSEKKGNIPEKLLSIFFENLEWLMNIEVDDERKSIVIPRRVIVDKIIPPVKAIACSGLHSRSLTFAPDGYVYTCMEFAQNKLLPLGKYYPEKQIFEKNITEIKKRNIFNLEMCHDCNLLPVCAGGCPFRDLSKTQLKDLKEGNLSLLECRSCIDAKLMTYLASDLFFKLVMSSKQ